MRILLVEDNPQLADGLSRALRQSDYAVDWIADGARGRRGLRRRPRPRRELNNNPLFHDSEIRGEEVRVVFLKQAVTAPGIAGRFSVQVAQTRGERDLLTRELALSTGIRLLVMIVLVALITWFGTRFGLKPLDRLRAEIR